MAAPEETAVSAICDAFARAEIIRDVIGGYDEKLDKGKYEKVLVTKWDMKQIRTDVTEVRRCLTEAGRILLDDKENAGPVNNAEVMRLLHLLGRTKPVNRDRGNLSKKKSKSALDLSFQN